jgi:hypothetical protein
MSNEPDDLGWWVIHGEELLAGLQRAAEGEDPGAVYAELYANSDVERPGEEEATAIEPPEAIALGPHRYRVDASEQAISDLQDEHATGNSVPDRLLIRLDGRRPHSVVAETLLHECLHCAWSLTALGPHEVNEHQEVVVTALAPWLLEALRQNPDLVAFLTA